MDNEEIMNRFKLLAGVILVFLVGTLAGSLGAGVYFKHRMERFAAGGPPRHLRKVLLMKRLSNELDLTKEQRIEIEKIIKESANKIFAVRRKYLPDIKEITDQSFALMKEKLNADQKERLEELHEKLKDRHAKTFIQSIQIEETPEQVLSKMKDRLNLTEEQATKVRPIIEGRIERLRKIVEEYREQDRPEIFSLRREMRELQESTVKPLASILTEEQLEDYRRMQEEERFERRREMGRRKLGRFD
jgi:hypothetical protein